MKPAALSSAKVKPAAVILFIFSFTPTNSYPCPFCLKRTTGYNLFFAFRTSTSNFLYNFVLVANRFTTNIFNVNLLLPVAEAGLNGDKVKKTTSSLLNCVFSLVLLPLIYLLVALNPQQPTVTV